MLLLRAAAHVRAALTHVHVVHVVRTMHHTTVLLLVAVVVVVVAVIAHVGRTASHVRSVVVAAAWWSSITRTIVVANLALLDAESLGVNLALLFPVDRLLWAFLACLARDTIEERHVLVVEMLSISIAHFATVGVRVVGHIGVQAETLLHEHVRLFAKIHRLRLAHRRLVLILLIALSTADLELVSELFLNLLLESGVRLLEVELALELERLATASIANRSARSLLVLLVLRSLLHSLVIVIVIHVVHWTR